MKTRTLAIALAAIAWLRMPATKLAAGAGMHMHH